MYGVQCRSTFHVTFDKNMQGLTLTCLSTCPSDKEVTEHVVVLFDVRNHFNKIKCTIIPIPLLQRIRQMMLPSAYWLLSLFKPVSKYNTAPLRQKKLFTWHIFQKCLEMYTFCALVGSIHPYCWLQIIYHWANNSLTSNEYEQMCTGG